MRYRDAIANAAVHVIFPYLSPVKSNIPNALKWTARDSASASREGWNIFNWNYDSSPAIQRDDDMNVFGSDAQAIAFVLKSAARHARKALLIVGK